MTQTVVSKKAENDESHRASSSLLGSFTQTLTPKSLISYPEELHKPTKEDCTRANSRIMKHLMKGKMQKQKTFL
jgi:hypothetical protein